MELGLGWDTRASDVSKACLRWRFRRQRGLGVALRGDASPVFLNCLPARFGPLAHSFQFEVSMVLPVAYPTLSIGIFRLKSGVKYVAPLLFQPSGFQDEDEVEW